MNLADLNRLHGETEQLRAPICTSWCTTTLPASWCAMRGISTGRRPTWCLTKRVYPERTDLEFARLLPSHRLNLRFASFDPARYDRLTQKPFHGVIYDSATRGLADVEGGSL